MDLYFCLCDSSIIFPLPIQMEIYFRTISILRVYIVFFSKMFNYVRRINFIIYKNSFIYVYENVKQFYFLSINIDDVKQPYTICPINI